MSDWAGGFHQRHQSVSGKKIAAHGGCLKNLPEATGWVFWVWNVFLLRLGV